jgi:hypothetical protein
LEAITPVAWRRSSVDAENEEWEWPAYHSGEASLRCDDLSLIAGISSRQRKALKKAS